MEEENVVSYFHGAAAMADKDLCVSNKEELVSDDPDVYLGDEPSLEVGEDANIEGSGDNVAFAFYNLYAKMNKFATKKRRLRQNTNEQVRQQQFVCFRQGFKEFAADKEAHEQFEARWERLVTELQLQNNRWVCDLYDWRKMWVIARIRGHFFGRFWTTSKYEGLHSTLGNFFHSHHNLKDFIEQFFHCVSEMRSQQTQSDMHSMVGHLVLQSPLHDLEVYCKITNEGDISLVSANAVTCMYIKGLVLIESLGIPCDHIAALLVHLDFMEIPMSFALERWSKNARSKGQQPSHEDDVDEDNYYTPNFGEEVDEVCICSYHSQPMEQEEHFSPDEEDFQMPLTNPYYSLYQ
ncbi:hypothetical protein Ahy_A05g022405 [Arachis hypogaea]|uniref:Protein FAR1-RELATED SEQUENCE n=1 Tax=Arachis hypogaea TaxID=3818 RepID=A0A445D0P0_ARAHY|nr:hypothetical protein Ahy_A05g022405 [Arachis hypogaea]